MHTCRTTSSATYIGWRAQVTPASSTWPQLVLPQPENLHWVILSSFPVHATSSIQMRPVPGGDTEGGDTEGEMWVKGRETAQRASYELGVLHL